MTIIRLLKKYQEMAKEGFDIVNVSQVIDDLYSAVSHQRMLRIPRDKR